MSKTYLHLGAGTRRIPGFINIDVEPGAELQLDLTQPLPWPDGSVHGIYSEHFIEHIAQADAIGLLRECRRVLVPGGLIRIATPDLREMVLDYLEGRVHPDWEKFGLSWTANVCERLNIGMRWWGHQWMYDEEELTRLAQMVGLTPNGRHQLGESGEPLFCNLEYRESSTLILEFRKPNRMLTANERPLVSITIPSYKPDFFETALQSALNQTYREFEIVICDDCPDDGIRRIVDNYIGAHPNIRYFRNETRLNRENLVKCVAMAQGEFVKFLNDDDVLLPHCIERMLDCFRCHPDLTFVTSKRQRIDPQGQALEEIFETLCAVSEDAVIEGVSLGTCLLSSFRNFVGEPTTALFRKREVTHFEPDYIAVDNHKTYGINDVAVWCNLAVMGNAAYLCEPLSLFRIHPKQAQLALRDEVLAGALEGIKILRASWDRRGLSRGQQGNTLLWKPLGQPQSPWRARGIIPTNAGWQDIPLPPEMPQIRHQQTSPPPSLGHLAPSPLAYDTWLEKRCLDDLDAAIYREHVEKLWPRHLLCEFIMHLRPDESTRLADTIDSLSEQYYDGWRLTIFSEAPSPESDINASSSPVRWIRIPDKNSFVASLEEGLKHSHADWLGLFPCGTRFAPHALLAIGDHAAQNAKLRAIYTDEDIIDDRGSRHSPQFKPDFNLELLRAKDYIGGIFICRDALLNCANPVPDSPLSPYDAVLRVADLFGDSAIGHIADVLTHAPEEMAPVPEATTREALRAHLARRGHNADLADGLVPGVTRRLRYRHPVTASVSIIIPTRNRLDLLGPCIESLLRETPSAHWELILVDNDSDDPALPAYYETLQAMLPGRLQLLRHPGSFDFAAMNNRAAEIARGDYLLLLNNDTVCIHDDWLEAMLNQAQRPDVGIVGARLLYPDTLRIQHAGIVLGMSGAAGHIFSEAIGHDEGGYLDRALLDQEYSAVTGACLMIRADLYRDLGGLDGELFKVSYNDIDLCLKVRDRGLKVIYTPHATLLHHGSASQNATAPTSDKIANFQRETARFIKHWLPRLATDPAWNRHLSLASTTPEIEAEIVPTWNPDFRDRPRILALPAATAGTAEYRNLAPLRALHAKGEVQYAATCQARAGFDRAPTPIELARAAPDTLLIHAPVDNVRGLALQEYKTHNSGILRVFSLDDLITNIPADNPTSSLLTPSVMRERLQLGLAACDRLIVSTAPLAEACRGMIDDIRIIPNRLALDLWGNAKAPRRVGKKLRVGWVGAQQHAGDLKLLQPVIEATHREVDWIFLGMQPEGVSAWIAETHEFVHPLADYPAKLASLDLDLAVAPLEIHAFNEAKSNLRLLEYGYLGWPVICTDILPYQTDAPPVLRLPNDPARWIAAIRERIGESSALAKEGDALRTWVCHNFILEEKLDDWLAALTR